MFHARFDDAISGVSRVLSGPVRSLATREATEVRSVVSEAASAAREGKWVAGYVSYEAASAFDPALVTAPGDGGPLVWFGVFDDCSIESMDIAAQGQHAPYMVSPWQRGITATQYSEAFATIKNAIRNGDTYQVNLTFPLAAAFTGEADSLYRDLISSQRPAYAAYIHHDDRHLVSVSPERFFAVHGGTITTRPMKGTARRGRWLAEDEAVRGRLEASDKDRAENLMIVDLIRNDLGRIARFGTVSVDALFAIEQFETLWQMTSTVSAELRPDVGLTEIFGALFPCGSVTGAPKASSMAVIADVELGPRGVYCGAIGFVPPGDGVEGASFNVAIRTAVIDAEDGVATYGVGGAITWDSTRDSEYEETATKALVLTRTPAPDSLIETIRWDPDREDAGSPWVWLEEHLDRLAASGAYWGIPFDRSGIHRTLDRASEGFTGPGRARLEIDRSGTISCTTGEAPEAFRARPGEHASEIPAVLAVSRSAIDASDPRMFHKIGDRAMYERQMRLHPNVDDVLLVNQFGRVTETTIANVVFRIDGVWVTPPIEDGLLPGVMRQSLIDDGYVKERSVDVGDAIAADAIAIVNSVRGWRAAMLGRPD